MTKMTCASQECPQKGVILARINLSVARIVVVKPCKAGRIASSSLIQINAILIKSNVSSVVGAQIVLPILVSAQLSGGNTKNKQQRIHF